MRASIRKVSCVPEIRGSCFRDAQPFELHDPLIESKDVQLTLHAEPFADCSGESFSEPVEAAISRLILEGVDQHRRLLPVQRQRGDGKQGNRQ